MIAASRLTGIAPLAVYFETTVIDSSPTESSFHDLDYTWDFGDDPAALWSTTGLSKNIAKGALSAHVFMGAGTFTVTLTVRDINGVVSTTTETITVTAEDVGYAGANTTVVNNVGDPDFSAAPSGAVQLATDTWADVITATTDNHRVLLKAGTTFTTASPSGVNGAAGQRIGKYGVGADPIVTYTGSGSQAFLNLWGFDQTILSNIDFRATSSSGSMWSLNPSSRENLLLNCSVQGFGTSVVFSDRITTTGEWLDLNMVVGCTLFDTTGGGLFFGGERSVILGTEMRESASSHLLRTFNFYKGILSNCILHGSATNNATQHILKLHGPRTSFLTPTPTAGERQARFPTKFVIVSDNIFGGGCTWATAIGPQNGGTDEKLFDVIFERNRIAQNFGVQSLSRTAIGTFVWASYSSVRNNVYDLTGAADSSGAFVQFGVRGVEGPHTGNKAYNNTFYRKDNADGRTRRGVRVAGASVSNTEVFNNLLVLDNNSNNTLLVDDTGVGTTIQTNLELGSSTDLIDPDNIVPKDRDYTPSNVLAIDSGTPVLIYDDFEATARPQTGFDIGAYVAGGVFADTTAPVITLNGSAQVTIDQGSVYTDLGATAIDDTDGSISVVVGGTIDTAVLGAQVLTYNASDAAGNPAVEVTRTVTVVLVDQAISLTGSVMINISVDTTFNETVNAGNVTVDPIQTTIAGSYAVTYTETDEAGNVSQRSQNVDVIDNKGAGDHKAMLTASIDQIINELIAGL